MSEEKAMSFKAAEELFEELLRAGPKAALDEIRQTACRRHLSPIQVLVEYGDPRKEKK
ncbi:MAG: hypothetical protein GY838_12950 [bacterium]|nr:hypothetical protein [bacterium]